MDKTKRILTAVALLGLFTALGVAQAKEMKFESGKMQKIVDKNIVPSLQSDIYGIVEGSIYNIVLSKRFYSSLDFTNAGEKLKQVIADHSSPAIRYKAHLALIYLSNADSITITPVSKSESYDYLFRQISEEVSTKLLGNDGTIVQK
ncbi:MAG: hypothetical protein WCW35_05620 [Bacteroidota bacterium]